MFFTVDLINVLTGYFPLPIFCSLTFKNVGPCALSSSFLIYENLEKGIIFFQYFINSLADFYKITYLGLNNLK